MSPHCTTRRSTCRAMAQRDVVLCNITLHEVQYVMMYWSNQSSVEQSTNPQFEIDADVLYIALL